MGGTLGPIDESAPEAAACAGSVRGERGGVTLGIDESIRVGLLELVGWLDLRLITNEIDKDSGISRNNHHNLLMGRVTARYAMEWMTLWRVGARRGVSEPLVPVAVGCERSELYTASNESTNTKVRWHGGRTNDVHEAENTRSACFLEP